MKVTKFLLTTTVVLILMLVASSAVSAKPIKMKSLPDINLDEDITALNRIDLDDYFSSDNGEIHFFYASVDNKVGVTIHDDGAVDFSPSKDWFGAEEITFIATDGEQEVSDTIFVTVNPVNDRPKLLKPLSWEYDLTFNEDEALVDAIDLRAHFIDIDSTLMFSSSSENIIVQIDDDGIVDFLAPKDWSGQEEVTFTASDEELETSDSVLVKVTEVNDVPRLTVNSASVSLTGDRSTKALALSDYFIDVDDEELDFEVFGNDKINCEVNLEKDLLLLSASDDWRGEELITVTAKDNSGKSSSMQMVVIVSHRESSSSPVFFLLGIVLAVAITAVRLQIAGRRQTVKSPVKLSNYRHYKGN